MNARNILRTAVVALLAITPLLHADEKSAKDYVDQAEKMVGDNDMDNAKGKLDLAEAELDGVDAGAKTPIVNRISELRNKINGAAASLDKDKYTRRLKLAMDEAEGSIGNLVTWGGAETAVKEIFDDPAAKAALGDELTAAQKKFATFKKLNAKKAEVQLSEAAEQNVKAFEDQWAQAKPKIVKPDTPGDKDTAITDMDHAIENVRRTLGGFASDSPARKGFADRVDKIAAEYTQLALADQVKDKVSQLKDSWDSYKEEWTGWDAEKTGPSLATYASQTGGVADELNCPKTVALIARSNQWLKNRDTDEDYQKMQSAPEIKAIVDKVTTDRAAAWAKMQKLADAVITEAEAKKPADSNTTDAMSRLADHLKNLIEGSDAVAALTDRATHVANGTALAAAAKNAESDAFYKAATAKAAADWPGIKEKFNTTDGFDPSSPGDFKGKLIVLTTDNLMGYNFSPGDFKFATTLNGVPLACKYDPAVAAAVTALEAKIGRGLGESDDDGKWEIVCKVTGKTGKLVKKTSVEGKIKDTAGNEATVTGERGETVDAPILTIVAAHCGPLAVAGNGK